MAEVKEYDVVILGGGSAGYATALRSAQLGLHVALVEGDKVGGTCLHYGCIPTKALLHAAEVADETREAQRVGVQASLTGIDMPALQNYKNGIIAGMFKGLQGLLKGRKVDVINGWGKVTAPHTVTVDGTEYRGKNLVLASGSYSKTIGQQITKRVLTSTEALNLQETPKSIIVLGGGVIGVEFSSAFRSYGADVQIIEGLPTLVHAEDPEIGKNLERQFRKRGIKFATNTMFDHLEETDHSVKVFTQDGKEFEAEYLLIAIGRAPRTEGMGYEEIGVNMDRGFVLTDERLRTNIDGVYAVGDIVPGIQLAHRGYLQGMFVAEEIAGLSPRVIDETLIPRITFCEPEIASVGLNQDKAEAKYGKENIVTASFNLAGNGKSQILGAQGFVKLVRVKDGPIVGFHAIGKRMGEQIGEGLTMVGWQAYPEDYDGLIHPHPTQNEAIGEVLLKLAGKPLHN
ncbi:dihydrolipoamide dehydrogenase [Actinobaculum suis]|uniref:dihydrolipoyl dehydrogenase n=1 Tax=Actinobaculum suis TaxID=1657 RepID=UPI00066FF3F5|nr:dihydrolipoyl dehydrogenase [Actinobaculum suis]KMY22880.1 dihydrolipoamide dehydrogenase [Actinobaculum suis]